MSINTCLTKVSGGGAREEVRQGLPSKADDTAFTHLHCALQLPFPYPPSLFPSPHPSLGFREKGKGCCRPWRTTQSQHRTLVYSASCRSIHKAFILVVFLVLLSQIRFNRISQKGKTQYTILYLETPVIRRPFQNPVNLILISRNEKGSFSAMSSQNFLGGFVGHSGD